MNSLHDTKTVIGATIDIPAQFSIDQVISADGTTIGYRQIGIGPGLIIVHGGGRASHHYLRLAELLSDSYTVYLPDRRGRGLSGPKGENYSIAKELDDIRAILQKTHDRMLFGHNGGGSMA